MSHDTHLEVSQESTTKHKDLSLYTKVPPQKWLHCKPSNREEGQERECRITMCLHNFVLLENNDSVETLEAVEPPLEVPCSQPRMPTIDRTKSAAFGILAFSAAHTTCKPFFRKSDTHISSLLLM